MVVEIERGRRGRGGGGLHSELHFFYESILIWVFDAVIQ